MTTVEKLLQDIRDLIAHRGPQAARGEATSERGVETPLIMAELSETPKSFVGQGPDFRAYTSKDVHHYVGGELCVIVQSIPPAGALSYYAEVMVTGWIGKVPDVLAIAAVNSGSGPLIVPWFGGASAFDHITVSARQVLNGVPTGVSPPDATLLLQLDGRVYR